MLTNCGGKLNFLRSTPTKFLRITLSTSTGISLKACLSRGNSGIDAIPSATLKILITFGFSLLKEES